MNIRPSLETIRELAYDGEYDIAPLSLELLMDFTTPIEALRILQQADDHVFLLESASSDETWGRYSFLGFAPKLEITCSRGILCCNGEQTETRHPQEYIRDLLARCRSPRFDWLPPFTGGLMGYFSFESMAYAEPVLYDTLMEKQTGNRDLDLMLFDQIVCFDHCRQKLILMVNMDLHNPEEDYDRAVQKLLALQDLLQHGPRKALSGRLLEEPVPLLDKEAYMALVKQGKHHIREGDIFQIVLSNELQAPFEGSLLNMYRHLRTLNPSPYLFYFCGADLEAAGASPETLVRLQDRKLKTFPLAGTRPRGKSEEEDLALEQELLADEKELAEHDMLVDLGRNDLGRISRPGSVQVKRLHAIERFSHVMHIGSEVHAEIAENRDALDAVQSALPAGTLSGAPKIKAVSLIAALEPVSRGLYGGAVGYIDFTGCLDLAIAIRLAWKKDGVVHIRSGAGIVADSDPAREYQECLNKAGSCLQALHLAAQEV